MKNLEVQIGNALDPIDFHILDIKLNWNSSLLLGRAFMGTVGAVCNMQTNQLCLTLVDPNVYYDPDAKVSIDNPSKRNSAGIIKNIGVQIGNALDPIDFHILDIKLNWNSSLLLGRAFMGISIDTLVETSTDYSIGISIDALGQALMHGLNILTKFCGSYEAATREKKSGHNETDVLKLAHQIFYNNYKQRFTLEHTWKELRHDQKWCELATAKTEGSSKKKKCEDGADSSSSQATCSKPPPGVKAAKMSTKMLKVSCIKWFTGLWSLNKKKEFTGVKQKTEVTGVKQMTEVHGSLESKSKERVHGCKAKDRGHGCKAKDSGLWSLVTCHWSLVTCLWSLVITLSLESSRVFGVLSLYSVRAKERGHGALEFSVVFV
ncbi:hypothetical protein F2Q69_00035290 [Brassica cretica]|uniref:Uncharacterized protein n=1 Tax=Brassica cretica TaxID=69181 RepID=A0A8S9SPR1_BRACR|nr:hypothetical protein F2Q69_00035290 [Brassica cretica]